MDRLPVDLEDADTSNGVLVRDLGVLAVGGAEDDVDLTLGALGDLRDDVLWKTRSALNSK